MQRVLQCHGSFATASCINCHVRVPGNFIEAEIMSQTVPVCRACEAEGRNLPAEKVKKKVPKKKNAAPWESDGEEEPDVPLYPPGIMKVVRRYVSRKCSLTD